MVSPSADSYSGVAPRQLAVYECARGHEVTVWFSAEAAVPAAWDCRCGAGASIDYPAGAPEPVESDQARRMRLLLMRRSRRQLEQLLAERLAAIRVT